MIKKIGFERLDGGDIVKSEEWKQFVAGEKTKFKMKIIRGKKKVKWGKRRDGKICEFK